MVPQFGSSLKLRYEWDSSRNTAGYIPKIPQHIPQQCIIISGWCRTGANAKLLKKPNNCRVYGRSIELYQTSWGVTCTNKHFTGKRHLVVSVVLSSPWKVREAMVWGHFAVAGTQVRFHPGVILPQNHWNKVWGISTRKHTEHTIEHCLLPNLDWANESLTSTPMQHAVSPWRRE